MEEGLKKSDNQMDKFKDLLKLILRKLEEKDSLAGYTEEEEFDIGILTQEEIVNFATEEKSSTSAIVDDGCPSMLAGEQIIEEYFIKNGIDSTRLERKIAKG